MWKFREFQPPFLVFRHNSALLWNTFSQQQCWSQKRIMLRSHKIICPRSDRTGKNWMRHPLFPSLKPFGSKLINKKSRIYGTSDSFAKINLICQICQRVRSVIEICEADLWVRSERPCGRPIGLSHTPSQSHLYRPDSTVWGNAFSREISQIAPRIGLSAGVRERPIGLTDLRVRSVRPIGLTDRTLWLAQTDHMTKSVRPKRWEAEFGLSYIENSEISNFRQQ